MTTQLRAEYFKTPEEYLAAERVAEQKHEYLAGAIYAMAGTSADHERIAMNICRELGGQLRGKPCEVFSSNLKVRIRNDAAEFYYYPDAMVDCSGPAGNSYFAEKPRVIFEVLSPETERIDRGEKLRNYQTLSSLDVYVLVDQFHIAVTVYRRTGQSWSVEFLTGEEATLLLPGIECALSMAALYERTRVLR